MSENEAAKARAGEEEQGLVRYALDPAGSTFTVQAFAGGLLAGFGHNPTVAIRDFAGEAQFVPGSFADASVRVVVQARSLKVVGDASEKDRGEIERTMLDEVLEVSAYPQIVFESTSVAATRVAEGRFRARIVGNLTLHGTTRHGLWIMAQLRASGHDVRAQGDFTIKQTDYGIKLVSVAGGALKIKDELKFTFDLLGRRAAGGA